ncbi:hypothetical protein APV28_3914 [Comamonas testosteroni]|nr:hypothetical protein APV28_3914 [Comamonas testosteroni]
MKTAARAACQQCPESRLSRLHCQAFKGQDICSPTRGSP